MTRGKPLLFSRKPGSTARETRKRDAENRFKSGALPSNPPAELAGMPAARAAWRSLMRAHEQLPGEIFNALDRQFLIGYCLAVEARARALELEADLSKKYKAGEAALDDLRKVRVELRQSIRLVSDLEKQLYATPKSRAGVSPEAREPSPEEVIARELAAMDDLLEDDE